jgi:hypothetical protein
VADEVKETETPAEETSKAKKSRNHRRHFRRRKSGSQKKEG